MPGEKNLDKLLKTMKPALNAGDYVFCTVQDLTSFNLNEIVSFFREEEGITIIVKQSVADKWQLQYSFVASWITLTVHSSLEAVGLSAAFSKALADENISCNVVAAYFHDHIFTDKRDAEKAISILNRFSEESNKTQ
jgi:uncharacterized protein